MSGTAANASTFEIDDYSNLNGIQLGVMLVSIIIVALCGITYELIIGTASTYLLGNSVYQFSLTIGFFMFAMGLGSYLSRLLMRYLLACFVWVEIAISVIGGLCSLSLFLAYSMVNSFYIPVMYFFIITIGTLVGVEIPILTRILSQKEIIRKSISDVLSLDYVGALIGSVVFPLLLLPSMGLIRSSFVIALINILTAIVNLIYFRDHLIRIKPLAAAAITTLVLLMILTLAGSRLTSFAEHHLYQDQVVVSKQTPYQKIVFTRKIGTGEYRMYIDGHILFAQRDEHRYHEALVHPVMSLPGTAAAILVLGGGDGLAVRELMKYPGIKRIDLVDIDPQITAFAAEFPPLIKMNHNSLNLDKVHVINADAFSFINQPGMLYDRVIIDMPDPHNEALNKLYSREFYRMIKRRLQPHGAIVTQSSSPFFARRTFWSIAKTLRAAGFKVFSYKITVPSFGIWGYHIASPDPVRFEQMHITVPTRYLTEDVLAAASVFGKDISPIEVPVNTLLEPKLYLLYVTDLQQ